MRQLYIRLFATLAVAAFGLAACGSSSKSSAPPSTTVATTTTLAPAVTTTSTAAPSANATVKVGTTTLGKVLTDSSGLTLYRFDNDTTAGTSTCTGQCASAWPAATATGTPTAGPGVTASALSTFKRPDGTTQLQIAGHPLYRFAGDSKAGDTNGQGILGKWHAAAPNGDKVT